MRKRDWFWVGSAALVSEVAGAWLQSDHHATDVPFAVTYMKQSEYVSDRLILWAVIFIPLFAVAYFFSCRKAN